MMPQTGPESTTHALRLTFMPRAVAQPLPPADWHEARQLLNDMRRVLDLLARELPGSEKLAEFRIFMERRTSVGELLRGMQDVILDRRSRKFCVPLAVRPTSLSPRERSVLMLISTGLSNKCIARELQITPETVKSHTRSMLAKLNAKTRAEAVALAASMNII